LFEEEGVFLASRVWTPLHRSDKEQRMTIYKCISDICERRNTSLVSWCKGSLSAAMVVYLYRDIRYTLDKQH
jgi:hypothetical protein